MDSNWLGIFLGWLGGIPTGVLANWLFLRLQRWRKSQGEYFTTTVSGDIMEFEGRVKVQVSAKQIAEDILGTNVSQISDDGNG